MGICTIEAEAEHYDNNVGLSNIIDDRLDKFGNVKAHYMNKYLCTTFSVY